MLAIISDLHFCDKTAMQRTVQPSAFRMLMEEIYEVARDNLAREPERRQLDIVLLGDIFDLLRTERWFLDQQGQKVPLRERPWGSADALDSPVHRPETLLRARAITQEIIDENREVLALLRGEGLSVEPLADCQVRRIYLPGNHDRLYLHDPEVRRLIRAALGSVDETALGGEGIFPHRLEMPRYGLLARHGHEWDGWNFERHRKGTAPLGYTDEDYLYTPIGDPITTELVARLPFELRQRLQESAAFRDTPELEHIYQRMQQIEDVRPLLSSFQWIFYEAESLHGKLPPDQASALQVALNDTLATLSSDFQAMDFYKAWYERHDRFAVFDIADRMQMLLKVLGAFQEFSMENVGKFLNLAETAAAWWQTDPCRIGAPQEDLTRLGQSGLRCVVYGHTHEPLQAAMRAGATSDLYLNSGTFRERQFATQDQRGFIGWQHYSYIVLYDEHENTGIRRRGPTYELWQGNLGAPDRP